MSYCQGCADLQRENARLTAERDDHQMHRRSLASERDALVTQLADISGALNIARGTASRAQSEATAARNAQVALATRCGELEAALTPFAQEWKFMQDNPHLANGVVRNNKALEAAWALWASAQEAGKP